MARSHKKEVLDLKPLHQVFPALNYSMSRLVLKKQVAQLLVFYIIQKAFSELFNMSMKINDKQVMSTRR